MGDTFTALGILLVFATIALDIFIKDAKIFIQKLKPDSAKKKEIKNYSSAKYEIICKLFGVLIFYILLFWLLIPKSVEIVKTSKFELWDFNLISTYYILINICLLFFILLTTGFLIKLFNKHK